jgi:hypothetical protein
MNELPTFEYVTADDYDARDLLQGEFYAEALGELDDACKIQIGSGEG